MRKGLAVLHQKNMLETCYRIVQQQEADNHLLIELLEQTHGWVSSMSSSLSDKSSPDSPLNIVLWYQANKLPDLYLSLSQSCDDAMSLLSEEDRSILPRTPVLRRIRKQFLSEISNERAAKRILKDDLQ